MIVESSASLVITSATMTVEQITQSLGITPSTSRNIGDPHGAPRPDASGVVVQRTARETFWRLESGAGLASDSFSSMVVARPFCRYGACAGACSGASSGHRATQRDLLLVVRLGAFVPFTEWDMNARDVFVSVQVK
jgi:Domain of unknown function (DUF4279)